MRRNTVLIVEDDAAVTKALEDLLSEQGYETLIAKGACSDAEAIRSPKTPDLIVIDRGRGTDRARAFLAATLADPRYANVPVVAIGSP